MTDITIDTEGRTVILATGHADYAEEGKDIVCASISAIIYSFIYFLDKECIPYDAIVESGYISIKTDYNGDALTMLSEGLDSIADEYPDNVIVR